MNRYSGQGGPRLADWARWCWFTLVSTGCAFEGTPDPLALDGTEQAIIYGNDDRRDVYEHPDPILRGLARSSVVALIPRSRLSRSADGEITIFTQPLEDAFHVCADERFAAQPTAAECSGVLIDDDLVLTAGHCFPSDTACARYAFLFDYFLRAAADPEPLSLGDIYACRRIVKRVVSSEASLVPRIDYAIVQLDRPAVGRTAVSPRTSALLPGEPLATIGCASGLPAKIDSGAHALATRDDVLDYFVLDSDTFQGSSGSGVFDVNGSLLGVLVRGGEDYVDRSNAMCKVPKVVSWPLDAGPPRSVGEEATYVARAIEGLCSELHWPSEHLCGVSARCGDGICNDHETQVNCPADCACKDCPPDQLRSNPGPIVRSALNDGGCTLAPRGASHVLFALFALFALALRKGRGRQPPS
ncbi:MAG TPA: serine protease [Polyangiales bacterium]